MSPDQFILLSFDESHCLFEIRITAASPGNSSFTYHDALSHALDTAKEDVFSLFLSTNPRLIRFAPN